MEGGPTTQNPDTDPALAQAGVGKRKREETKLKQSKTKKFDLQ